jgi:hypothetical protein
MCGVVMGCEVCNDKEKVIKRGRSPTYLNFRAA